MPEARGLRSLAKNPSIPFFGCSAKIECMQEQIQLGFDKIPSSVGLRGIVKWSDASCPGIVRGRSCGFPKYLHLVTSQPAQLSHRCYDTIGRETDCAII